MLIWNKIFVFELRPTKFGDVVALPKGFLKMPKKVDQSSPVLAKSGPKFPKFTSFGQKWTKVQISTPNISSHRGF